jgi:hypothetical protein
VIVANVLITATGRTRDSRPYWTAITAQRIRYFTGWLPSRVASLVAWWCRTHHRDRWRVRTFPSAGRSLWWDVDCLNCGTSHQIETPQHTRREHVVAFASYGAAPEPALEAGQ